MDHNRINLGKYCVISIWFGCNNDCTICMLSNVKSNLPVIGFDQYRKVLTDIMRDGRFENLILSGAEVTTFDSLDQYIRCAASIGWFKKIQIQTNGRRLSDRAYVEHLMDCGVNEFFVSIHGLESTHDATTRVAGSFADTAAGLRNLAECKANVISNTVLTQRNASEILPLFAFLARQSISEMQLWNFFPMGQTDMGNQIVDLGTVSGLFPGLASLSAQTGKPIVLKSFPQCIFAGSPLHFDSIFPVTVLPDLFWKQFGECGFGRCFYRKTGQCKSWQCWGLSSAYVQKYGDERGLLRPIGKEGEKL